jgi:hypothetical protein
VEDDLYGKVVKETISMAKKNKENHTLSKVSK